MRPDDNARLHRGHCPLARLHLLLLLLLLLHLLLLRTRVLDGGGRSWPHIDYLYSGRQHGGRAYDIVLATTSRGGDGAADVWCLLVVV